MKLLKGRLLGMKTMNLNLSPAAVAVNATGASV